jgi:TetR/AcrR family tetracycline transcriptional repressor
MKLDRQAIAEAGLELLAEGGMDNLSTRKLASRLGVKSASLYHHFRNKQQLLDEIADAMIRPAFRPIGSGEASNEWLFDIGTALRTRILSYPDGGLLYAGASPPPIARRSGWTISTGLCSTLVCRATCPRYGSFGDPVHDRLGGR